MLTAFALVAITVLVAASLATAILNAQSAEALRLKQSNKVVFVQSESQTTTSQTTTSGGGGHGSPGGDGGGRPRPN